MLCNKKEAAASEASFSMCRGRAFVKTGRYNHKAPRSLQYSTLTDKIVKAWRIERLIRGRAL